jgi:dTDP-4-amino-4,6-dideoxygalactose transaminase
VTLPAEPEGHGPVYHLYVIRHPDRDALRDHLKERGIACDVQYPLPLSHQPAFKDCRVAPGGVPVTEKAVTEILSLPMYPALSRESVEEVAAAIRDFRR